MDELVDDCDKGDADFDMGDKGLGDLINVVFLEIQRCGHDSHSLRVGGFCQVPIGEAWFRFSRTSEGLLVARAYSSGEATTLIAT